MTGIAAVEGTLLEGLHKLGLIKKEEDIIKDALSEMLIKYGRFSKGNASSP